jgi:DNA-binding MarR family transcriptional regulator
MNVGEVVAVESGSHPIRLLPAEYAAWRAFLTAHARAIRVLGTELEDAQAMPLSWYDVLVQLSEAPGRELRMSELADAVLLSRSGLTRLIDRIVKEGLVERRPCLDDARGTLAALTDAGLERLRDAAPVHLQGVRQHFTSRFSEAELETLAALLARVGPVDVAEVAVPQA